MTDHIDTPSHKFKAATPKNQTQITFLPVSDDTILEKVTFAELKMVVLSGTPNIPLSFHDSLPTTIYQVFSDSQIALTHFSQMPHFYTP